jgi:hypothetical protein
VELPTYTSIWRIERRLYKLYDFRLPIPLPVGQITVFAGICVPYVAILGLLGVPFSHTLFWLYVLPPGVLTWLVTRPVLQGKRLPELLRSQVRYLAEPRLLCRMAPFSERGVVVVTGRIWRVAPATRATPTTSVPQRRVSDRPLAGRGSETVAVPGADVADPQHGPAWLAPAPEPARASPGVAARTGPARTEPAVAAMAAQAEPAWAAGPPTATFVGVDRGPRRPWVPGPMPSRQPTAAGRASSGQRSGSPVSVEQAPADEVARRGQPPGGRVVVVPGGGRPGGPDRFQRDRARARLLVGSARRVVVLGCTVGAGQTTTALFCGEALASLRSDPVAVLDLNPAPAGLTALAAARPALSRAAALGASRLAVLAGSGAGERAAEDGEPGADLERFERAAAGNRLVLADPAAGAVPRLLGIADQLVLVAPASDAAASAIAMTMEWLEAHGHADLVHGAIVVVNGASRRSMSHVQQAERICVGRCRAIVRIPWDDQLNRQRPASPARQVAGRPGPAADGGQCWTGVLDPATFGAYTALAGVLVSALASQRGSGAAAADRGQARVGTVIG